MPRYTDLVASLPATVPFVGPETQERARGRPFAARLGANENVFGPSPLAIEAMAKAAKDSWMYGDPENHDLKQALAAHLEITPDSVVVGEGIDGLLGYLVRMIVEPGVKVVTSLGAYPTFNFHVSGYGGALVTVAYKGDHEDPRALIAKAAEIGAKLVYLANPDNPMGTVHSAGVIQQMIDAVPDGCLLVLDEAYLEFAPEGNVPPINPNDPKVIRMRTFSKAYGMAGARVGYAIGAPELITAFNKIRNHFGMCRISQAGALAALQDRDHLGQTIANVAAGRDRIAEIAAAQGLPVVPSATNFVAVDCGAGADFATAVLQNLIERDIFVRMPFVAPQNRCIRLSVGKPGDLDRFEQAFPQALSAAKQAK
ncbi:MAG: pyridoxal phosphate-dependent aminotransferase [Rhodobacteraceae bacterium]|nr:pyridoxal phosphate-dependent aminotransferase [Paracoccaceae bacterium]